MLKRKQLFVFILLLAIAVTPMFATTMTEKSGKETLNLSYIKNAVNLIVGIFAGGYVLLKAALDIFHAVRNSSEDPNGLKKAIGGLILNIAILAGFMFVVNYVVGGMAKGLDGESINNLSAQQAFFMALTGTLVAI